MSEHLADDELADAAAGALRPARARHVTDHLRDCAMCADTTSALVDVSRLLREEPAPEMPEAVLRRLEGVLQRESALRAGAGSHPAVGCSQRPPSCGSGTT